MTEILRQEKGPFVVIRQKVGSGQTRAIIRKGDLDALKADTKENEIGMIHFIIDGNEQDEQVEVLPVPVKLLPPAMAKKNSVGDQFLLFNLEHLRQRTLMVRMG